MNRLIDAFNGLFTAATISGGELAKTANFTLENVNWKNTLSKPEPSGHHIVDIHLKAACAGSGRNGSSSHTVAQALLAVQPGDSIYHASAARHAMQTNEQPLLTVWLWTSHLDSEVVIVRGSALSNS